MEDSEAVSDIQVLGMCVSFSPLSLSPSLCLSLSLSLSYYV